MTEEELKATTCHKTMVPLINAIGAPAPCIGSACSAFRVRRAAKILLAIKVTDQGNERDEMATAEEAWCGLAGNP
jgi:hypothetical protein